MRTIRPSRRTFKIKQEAKDTELPLPVCMCEPELLIHLFFCIVCGSNSWSAVCVAYSSAYLVVTTQHRNVRKHGRSFYMLASLLGFKDCSSCTEVESIDSQSSVQPAGRPDRWCFMAKQFPLNRYRQLHRRLAAARSLAAATLNLRN